jgi:hypothetical protein
MILKSDLMKNKRNLVLAGIVLLVIIALFLFGLGGFGGSEYQASGFGCKPDPNFSCHAPIYSHYSGNITVTISQSSGTKWTTANFVFVAQGITSSNGIPSISFTSNPANTLYGKTGSGLLSQQSISITLPVSGPVQVGTRATGTIWAAYTTTGTQTYYAQIATIYIPAT